MKQTLSSIVKGNPNSYIFYVVQTKRKRQKGGK